MSTPPLTPDQATGAARAFGWIRIAIGVVLLVVPTAWSRVGFATPARGDALTAVRSAAIRDVALGAGALRTEDPEVLARWVEAGMLVDAGDVYAMMRARGMRPLLRAAVILMAGGATVVGGVVRRALRT